jgi:hypothetical protein
MCTFTSFDVRFHQRFGFVVALECLMPQKDFWISPDSIAAIDYASAEVAHASNAVQSAAPVIANAERALDALPSVDPALAEVERLDEVLDLTLDDLIAELETTRTISPSMREHIAPLMKVWANSLPALTTAAFATNLNLITTPLFAENQRLMGSALSAALASNLSFKSPIMEDVAKQVRGLGSLIAERNLAYFPAITGLGEYLNQHNRYLDSPLFPAASKPLLEFLPNLRKPEVASVAVLEAREFATHFDLSVSADYGLVFPEESHPRILQIAEDIGNAAGNFKRTHRKPIVYIQVLIAYLVLMQMHPNPQWNGAIGLLLGLWGCDELAKAGGLNSQDQRDQ